MNLIIKNLKKSIKDSKRLRVNLMTRELHAEVALIDNIIASQLIALDFVKHDNDMEEILCEIRADSNDMRKCIRGIGEDLVYIGRKLEPSKWGQI